MCWQDLEGAFWLVNKVNYRNTCTCMRFEFVTPLVLGVGLWIEHVFEIVVRFDFTIPFCHFTV